MLRRAGLHDDLNRSLTVSGALLRARSTLDARLGVPTVSVRSP
jgi:hypothetical protein